jgi:hypothetical protein
MSNSPSTSYVILLHHQLLTASAHLRHRSRMQCNAGVRKTAQLHFRIHLLRQSQHVADLPAEKLLVRSADPHRL